MRPEIGSMDCAGALGASGAWFDPAVMGVDNHGWPPPLEGKPKLTRAYQWLIDQGHRPTLTRAAKNSGTPSGTHRSWRNRDPHWIGEIHALDEIGPDGMYLSVWGGDDAAILDALVEQMPPQLLAADIAATMAGDQALADVRRDVPPDVVRKGALSSGGRYRGRRDRAGTRTRRVASKISPYFCGPAAFRHPPANRGPQRRSLTPHRRDRPPLAPGGQYAGRPSDPLSPRASGAQAASPSTTPLRRNGPQKAKVE